MKREMQRNRFAKKSPVPPTPHFNSRTRDYGLYTPDVRHNPSSGFSHSEAEMYRDSRSVNPNVRYVPDENNRDELNAWDHYSRRRRSRSPDEDLSDLVYEVLAKHPEIDVSQIAFDVHKGVIELEGRVETRRLKRLIEDVVYGLPGIHDVQNRIEVLRPDPDRRRIARSLA